MINKIYILQFNFLNIFRGILNSIILSINGLVICIKCAMLMYINRKTNIKIILIKQSIYLINTIYVLKLNSYKKESMR